jgi:hypothetical protein
MIALSRSGTLGNAPPFVVNRQNALRFMRPIAMMPHSNQERQSAVQVGLGSSTTAYGDREAPISLRTAPPTSLMLPRLITSRSAFPPLGVA